MSESNNCEHQHTYTQQHTTTYIQQHIIESLISFSSVSGKITNLEMETAGIYLMAKTLGHQALSLNALLANRVTGEFAANPSIVVDGLIEWGIDLMVL